MISIRFIPLILVTPILLIVAFTVIDRVDNYDYVVTDNHKNRPQYSSLSVESALNKLSLSEV